MQARKENRIRCIDSSFKPMDKNFLEWIVKELLHFSIVINYYAAQPIVASLLNYPELSMRHSYLQAWRNIWQQDHHCIRNSHCLKDILSPAFYIPDLGDTIISAKYMKILFIYLFICSLHILQTPLFKYHMQQRDIVRLC